jgi:hypothetical protein
MVKGVKHSMENIYLMLLEETIFIFLPSVTVKVFPA